MTDNSIYQYDLADAQELHRQYPDTFAAPAPVDVLALAPGAIVKLMFISDIAPPVPERMWVRVTATGGEDYPWLGELDSAPIDPHLPRAGTQVSFRWFHVMDYYR